MNRRFFLRGAVLLGCSTAAHPMMTSVTLAEGGRVLGENRLVVVILRGAMDGLDALRPLGDPLLASYRPTLGLREGTLDLDGFYALNQGLGGLLPLWATGELGFVQATSTPYRDKRSHFVGQDMLEAGTGMDVPLPGDGWLNRMLQAVPGLRAETAFAVGAEELAILHGAAPTRSWAPDTMLDLSPQARLLFEQVYHDDPLFQAAGAQALELSATDMGATESGMAGPGKMRGLDELTDFTAGRLLDETRIAAFSMPGWDTHRAQQRALPKSLQGLERVILRLREQLGAAVWGKTTLLAMTEFGRTARENGSGGTDHGTAGVMLVAGGAVKGGRVLGRWPGLADLYQGRDLMPTSDVRAWAAHAMRGLYGLDRSVLEGAVFPGMQMGDDPGLLR